MSESFHVNMRYSGAMVLKGENVNDLTNFYDYLPFKEDLALYLNNFEFPLPRDDFYHV
jgi:hypothetical protein